MDFDARMLICSYFAVSASTLESTALLTLVQILRNLLEEGRWLIVFVVMMPEPPAVFRSDSSFLQVGGLGTNTSLLITCLELDGLSEIVGKVGGKKLE